MNRNDPAERRGDGRQPRNEELAIQLVFPCEDGSCRPEVAQSVTLDVSSHGLRLRLDRALAPAHIYDLCVQVAGEPRQFLLTGETRWCRHNADLSSYEVGIEILPGEGTDFESWAAFFDAVG